MVHYSNSSDKWSIEIILPLGPWGVTDMRDKTRLIHKGRGDTGTGPHPVNPPVMRVSTVLFDTHADWRANREQRQHERVLSYGARGNSTGFELEALIADLEGGAQARLFPTGLAALGMVLLHYARAGGHILVSDGIYAPVRTICRDLLANYDVTVEYLRADCTDFEEKIRDNTDLLLCETPASVLYEMIDLPAVTAIARRHGIAVAVDNTYASGYLFNPLEHGANISIIAATKYLGGHSDVVMGIATCDAPTAPAFAAMSEAMGMTTSPDDAALVLRGMRTLDIRLSAHEATALQLAEWCAARSEIAAVYHPALPDHPGHAIWARDFRGANGMFTIEFETSINRDRADAFADRLELFGIGASWGGFESLATVTDPQPIRSRADWGGRGPMVRFHAGLEDPADLLDDLRKSFELL